MEISGFVSQSELDAMRRVAEMTLPDTGVILRPTYARDNAGGGSNVYAPAGTVHCRVDPTGRISQLGETAAVAGFAYDRSMVCPWDADIREDDQFEFEGTQYIIRRSESDVSWRVLKRFMLKAVEP